MKNLSVRLQEVLEKENLTTYKASFIISAKTNEPVKTINQRLDRWLKQTPKTWREIETVLKLLGYEIIIQKRK